MRIERADATRRNLHDVLRLIDEASGWLRSKNTDQWAAPWPTRPERDERVRRDLHDGKTWVVRDGDYPVSTVTIAERPNPQVWRESECDLSEEAVYVHRLVTARSHAGRGLGAQLIDWAGRRGDLQPRRARWIRIDVWRDNYALHDYYKMIGFERCGSCPDPRYPSAALFQKPVSEIGALVIPQFAGRYAEFELPARISCYEPMPKVPAMT